MIIYRLFCINSILHFWLSLIWLY